MDPDITIIAALVGGLLSFLSPCVLPLVPSYLVYLAGASLGQVTDRGPERAVNGLTVLAASLFVAGFSTVFVALGTGASAIGGLVRSHLDELAIVAGIVVVLMGLHFLGLIKIDTLMRQARVDIRKPTCLFGAYLMGLAFGFSWTPCIGPILAVILAVAASEATVTKGAGLLAVYSLGLGLPFIAAAFLAGPFAKFLSRFRNQLGHVEKVVGGLLVLTGIAFLTGSMPYASYWLLQVYPILGHVG
jgi:cytochrome c-type biogenesis protein